MRYTITDRFDARRGPCVLVRVGPSGGEVRERKQKGMAIPQPVEVLALIDTGAEASCMDDSLARRLGLFLHSAEILNAAAIAGMAIAETRNCTIQVVNPDHDPHGGLEFRQLPVLCIDLSDVGYSLLLGRDVLAKCTLTYDGPARTFSIAY